MRDLWPEVALLTSIAKRSIIFTTFWDYVSQSRDFYDPGVSTCRVIVGFKCVDCGIY